jgi:mono/diheme cytochrome c family protein
MRRLLSLATISLTFTACSGKDADLPEAFRRLAVPEAQLASNEARAKGRELFLENCAICHGVRGDGHGRRSTGFTTPPRNFTDPVWRRATTPRHVFFAIREGLHGTPMPAWPSFSDTEAWDLVAYVLSLGEEGRKR